MLWQIISGQVSTDYVRSDITEGQNSKNPHSSIACKALFHVSPSPSHFYSIGTLLTQDSPAFRILYDFVTIIIYTALTHRVQESRADPIHYVHTASIKHEITKTFEHLGK